MVDTISKELRSKVMASIRGKNTKPEIVIRKALWTSGIRYTIHDRSVVGMPDICFRSKKVAVFLDGCFWHSCPECYKEPKSNVEFWRNKAARNRARRKEVIKSLAEEGWTVLEFWEHQIVKEPKFVATQILAQLAVATRAR